MKKLKLFYTLTTLLTLALLTFSGCSMEPEGDSPQPAAAEEIPVDESAELTAYLGSLGFDTTDYFVEDGKIVVEGDIAFDIETIKKEIAPQVDGISKQYAHGYLVRQSRITYVRIRTTSNVTSAWSNAVNNAINEWNAIANCKIRLVPVSSSSYANITISRNSTGYGYVALASFPDALGNPGPTININPDFDDLSALQKDFVMVHELGHCLGMRHVNNTESGRIHIPGTPVTDANSVMHPFVRSWTRFSDADRNAAQYLYPSSGKYIVVYEHANYTGKRWVIHEGNNVSRTSSFFMNDKISSIRCFGGAKLTVYEHINYGGANMLIQENVSNLSTYNFNDTISSIKWTAPTGKFAIIYQHSNYRGRAITITGNIRYLGDLGFNDQLSSLKLYNGARIRLYEHSSYTGSSYYTSSSRSYVGSSMNDKTSSILFY